MKKKHIDEHRTYWRALAVVVALSAIAACGSSDDEASAEFTGDGCTYSGPSEFEVGDEIEITARDVAGARVEVGYGIVKVEDGTTAADVAELGLERLVDDDYGAFLWSRIAEQGEERVMSVTFEVAGTWLVNCFVSGESGVGDIDFPAVFFEVAPI